jgi:mannose-1-phosphate guanylyltransferase/mannose-6-phosphate isomerase
VIFPVILSGGSGTRLWPLSTPERPKQFLPLVGEKSLFAETLERVSDRSTYAPPVVVANAAHERLCAAELEGQQAELILEPIARNTAAAIVMAAALIAEQDPEAILLVMPSDHRIGRPDRFHAAIAEGQAAAKSGRLVTFGVVPTAPETGYGYLEAGEKVAGTQVRDVVRFVEKPDLATAEEMVGAGRFFWNGGIFMYSARVLLDECRALAPEIHDCAVAAIRESERGGAAVRPSAQALERCPSISIDYAIMERSDRIAMVPLDADWSDVGSWDALAQIESFPNGKSVHQLDSRDCYVKSDSTRVSLLGVDGLIVIATGDQVVIMRKGRSQEIKQLAAAAAIE